MKQKLVLILKLAALIALTAAGLLLFQSGYFFTTVLVAIIGMMLLTSILYTSQSTDRRMQQMIAAIRHGDLNISFPERVKGEEGELNRAMNQALASFRLRLQERIITEAEADSWQKLIRVLTHEMMNSLTPIISLSQTVLERSEDRQPDEKEYRVMLEAMQAIGRRSRGLLEFVENYRHLTRIPTPVKQVFQADELFRSIRDIFSEQENQLVFHVNPSSMRLHADRSLIEQVLINLIKNALEATGNPSDPSCPTRPTTIHIEAFEEQGRSIIRVADNGAGIVPEAMERIFIPFYTTKPGGSGIGLSLARQIIARHGGTLTAESEAGQGSVFTMRW